MRALELPFLFVSYLVWILYRWLVKKDIKQHMNDVYLGLFFFGVWGLILYFFFND